MVAIYMQTLTLITYCPTYLPTYLPTGPSFHKIGYQGETQLQLN
jgi:hypothetical protein